jgi:hypothetical protein
MLLLLLLLLVWLCEASCWSVHWPAWLIKLLLLLLPFLGGA